MTDLEQLVHDALLARWDEWGHEGQDVDIPLIASIAVEVLPPLCRPDHLHYSIEFESDHSDSMGRPDHVHFRGAEPHSHDPYVHPWGAHEERQSESSTRLAGIDSPPDRH